MNGGEKLSDTCSVRTQNLAIGVHCALNYGSSICGVAGSSYSNVIQIWFLCPTTHFRSDLAHTHVSSASICPDTQNLTHSTGLSPSSFYGHVKLLVPRFIVLSTQWMKEMRKWVWSEITSHCFLFGVNQVHCFGSKTWGVMGVSHVYCIG